MSAVTFDGVDLGYAGHEVLSGVSLDIARGHFVGLLGPNGAGKTSLLRAILGLIPPRRGRISVLGQPARRGHPAIAYIPQQRTLTVGAHLCGRDFVASAYEGQRWGRPWLNAHARRDIEAALDAVDAIELAACPIAELSGGQRQRLLLAQALIGKPELLLLDEPLASLDVHHQRHVVQWVDTVRQRLGITVLFSAHDLNALLGTLDRVLYLAAGRAAQGTIDEVITAPVLSRLYGSSVDVVRWQGRILVLPGQRAESTHA